MYHKLENLSTILETLFRPYLDFRHHPIHVQCLAPGPAGAPGLASGREPVAVLHSSFVWLKEWRLVSPERLHQQICRHVQKQKKRKGWKYITFYTILYYTILYYTILYYTILYYTILYYTILYYTILYYTILYYTILYYTILYYTILYYTILYYTILYYTILYYTILYYTILYYTILYYTILYHTTLYYTIPYYTILYYTILYYTILYYTILYYTILHYTIPYYTIQYNTLILYYTILYYTTLYYTILYYTILYYTILYYTILYSCYTLLYSTLLYYTVYGLSLAEPGKSVPPGLWATESPGQLRWTPLVRLGIADLHELRCRTRLIIGFVTTTEVKGALCDYQTQTICSMKFRGSEAVDTNSRKSGSSISGADTLIRWTASCNSR